MIKFIMLHRFCVRFVLLLQHSQKHDPITAITTFSKTWSHERLQDEPANQSTKNLMEQGADGW
jgi:hypothetical protein